jgi:very-short-patch-repair endonuclease
MNRRVRRTREPVEQAARSMRRTPTPAEAALWRILRNRSIGSKFRRQHPLGRFIVDFCCPSHRLVIELDGRGHESEVERDTERSEFLRCAGYEVVRFSNAEVLHHPIQTVRRVRHALTRLEAVNSPLPELGEGGGS